MKEFLDLLKNLKKGDKITLNVLLMISESQTGDYESLGKAVLSYYKDCMNTESIRWYLSVLCEKDENYLEYFSRYSKIFDNVNDKLTELFREYKNIKRVKPNEESSNTENIKKESINKENINKDSSKGVIDLYNILFEKIQCKLCGLRYKEGDPSYEVHIEDHMRKTRARDEKETLSREYFSTFDGWVRSMEKITLNLKIDKVEKIIYNGGTVYCKICGGKIEAVWDEEEDEFMLSDCVQLDEDEYCHKPCVI